VTTFLLSLTGLGLSTYMTIAHFTMPTILACSGTGELSCTKVTTSPESYALGIPVVILGLGYFTVMSILNSPLVWRRPERWLAIFRLTLSVVGMIFVLWLVAAEILIIGHRRASRHPCSAHHSDEGHPSPVGLASVVRLTQGSPGTASGERGNLKVGPHVAD
jgi:uncharacterized membrane protein